MSSCMDEVHAKHSRLLCQSLDTPTPRGTRGRQRITPSRGSPAGVTGGLPGGGGRNPRGIHEGSVPWARAHASARCTPGLTTGVCSPWVSPQCSGLAKPAEGGWVGPWALGAAPRTASSSLQTRSEPGSRSLSPALPPPQLLLHLRMRLHQGPDTTIVTDNCGHCVLWAYCVLGPVDREVGKSLPRVAHSGPKKEQG